MRRIGSLLAIAAAAASVGFVTGPAASAAEQTQASPQGYWKYMGPWVESEEWICKQSKANSHGKETIPTGPNCAKGVNVGQVIFYYHRWEA